MDAIPNNGWLLVNIKQQDRDGDDTTETWFSDNPNVTISQKGRISSLTQVSQLKVGVLNNNGSGTITNQVWINELHMSIPQERKGTADRSRQKVLGEVRRTRRTREDRPRDLRSAARPVPGQAQGGSGRRTCQGDQGAI